MALADLTGKLGAGWQVVLDYTEDLRRHDVLRAASAMAFHSFFSLVPLVAITGWVVHKLTHGSGELADPFMTLSFLALPVIPALKLTDRGLIDVEAFRPVSLFL